MTQAHDLQQLHAFADGQLDIKGQLDFEERMRTDPALQAQVQGLRQLSSTLREGADYHAAPAALRQRLAAAAHQRPEPAASATPSAASAPGRWLAWRPLTAGLGLATALALSVNLLGLQGSQEDKLLGDVVASHVRSTVGQHLVDVASSDHHTVKPWLSSKLGFSPQVSELPAPGSVFLGGRVDYLNGRTVAALVYRRGEHVINSFLWPTAAGDQAPRFTAERGFQVAHWSRGGMAHWVISDLNREEFAVIVQALEATDGAR
jgi:anti-sigma factor RsiW